MASFNPVTISTGEVSGSVTAKNLPDTGNCSVACVQAAADNAGKVYLGGAGVTKPDGTTDITTGICLQAGEIIWLITPINLNQLYIICDNAGDDVLYMVQK